MDNSEHLKRWILDCWVCVEPSSISIELPNFPGLYCIVAGDVESNQTILYVGMTEKSLRARFLQHHRWVVVKLLSTLSIPVYIYWWAVPYSKDNLLSMALSQWEHKLINCLQPTLNKSPVPLVDKSNK